MKRCLWRAAPMLMLLAVLGGCASLPRAPEPDSAGGEAGLSERESALFERAHFRLEGRIAVSDGRDGGSGRFEWEQRGSSFTLSFFAPVTQSNWRLESRPGQAVLVESNGAIRVADSAQELLARELRWQVPVEALAYWLRGMRAPGGVAEPWFDPAGRLSGLEQFGWRVEYRGYDGAQSPPLPNKLFARSGEQQVRMSVRRWIWLEG